MMWCDVWRMMYICEKTYIHYTYIGGHFITKPSIWGLPIDVGVHSPPWSADRYPRRDGAWSPMSEWPALCAAIAHRFRLLMADLRIDNVNTQLSERNWIVLERDIDWYKFYICTYMYISKSICTYVCIYLDLEEVWLALRTDYVDKAALIRRF